MLPGRLDFSRLVVELASEGDCIYFEAETVNFRFLSGSVDGEDDAVFSTMGSIGSTPRTAIIGCRLKAKLDLLPGEQPAEEGMFA